jgi:hypothetical protein
MDGEGYEFKEMYPAFIKEAEAEGNKRALISFRNAMAVEEIHHSLPSTSATSAGPRSWGTSPTSVRSVEHRRPGSKRYLENGTSHA